MARVLIVDDEPTICWGLGELCTELGHDHAAASSAEEALAQARTARFDAVLLDVRLPGRDGLAAMADLRAALPAAPIVVMTAYGDLATAVRAVREGACEYLLKPFDLAAAERALNAALHRPGPALEPEAQAVDGELVGSSPPMQEAFRRIALAAASEACVQLVGESGTGKELAARAIHRYSRRAAGPFVAVNLASLSPTLVESELFGHARGAFTGASETRRGLLEQADRGTLFLDEVADIPLPIQVKLLRALEQGEAWPVGGSQPVRFDCRIVSATHDALVRRMTAGEFRQDLYYRLGTFRIELPPLRARRGDIVELARHFLVLLASAAGPAPASLTAAAEAELTARPWYGNVRELRSAVEHALVWARGGAIGPEHLPPPLAAPPAARPASDDLTAALRTWAEQQWNRSDDATDIYQRLLALVEPPVLRVALERHQGQCAAAARRLGLHRVTLRKKLDQLGITW